MSDPRIGQYVYRRRTLAHLVESVVADDAITRCGRRMRDELGGLRYVPVPAKRICKGCR